MFCVHRVYVLLRLTDDSHVATLVVKIQVFCCVTLVHEMSARTVPSPATMSNAMPQAARQCFDTKKSISSCCWQLGRHRKLCRRFCSSQSLCLESNQVSKTCLILSMFLLLSSKTPSRRVHCNHHSVQVLPNGTWLCRAPSTHNESSFQAKKKHVPAVDENVLSRLV